MAKNRQLELDAAEIRLRAERRLGEMMEEGKEVRAKVGGDRVKRDGVSETPSSKPTLAEAGIDKNLAKRARLLAKSPADEFERQVGDWRKGLQAANDRVTVKVAKLRRSEETRHERKTAHVGKFDQRVKVFLDAVKKCAEETANAKVSIDKFSPETKKFAVRKIDALTKKLNELKKELENGTAS
jgi:hypothetical protein